MKNKFYKFIILSMLLIFTAESFAQSKIQSEKKSKILVAYFTWADNTNLQNQDAAVQSAMEHFRAMGDADKSGLDAVTSASVVVPGNTAMIAQWIKESLGSKNADTFSIVAKDSYPSDYNDCMDRAYREKSRRMRPQLKTHIPNFDDYDVIYLGFPNWWSSLPMPVLTFLEEYNFAGKTVIPFCAHGTGGIAATVRELKSALPKSATVLEPIGIYRAELLQSKEKVQRWVLKTTK